ncbi:MFS transporter [Brevundimonas diminuta]|uniref:MFS transporter n=1 Tax=Brevundimonas diminuta TaxID=293 RepID=UPI003D9A8ABE
MDAAVKTPNALEQATPLRPRLLAGYGLANIGLACFLITPQLLLLYFLTDTLAVPAATAGVVLLLPKIWEVVFDPVVGLWSDQLRGRMGRRWPLMAAGAALFPLGFAAMFAPPTHLTGFGAVIWVMAAYMAATTAYALFSIPYAAMPGEISRRQQDRTRVVAWRVGFLAFGLMVAGGMSPMLVEMAGGGRPGYAVMGLLLALMAGGALLGSLRAVWKLQDRQRDFGAPLKPAKALAAGVRATLGNPAYRFLWIGYAFQTVAMGAQSAMMPYAVTYQIQASSGVLAQLFLAGAVVQVAAMPLWVKIADRLGATRAAIGAATAYALATLGYVWCGPGDVALATAVAALAGLGQAGCYVLPFALMPSVVAARDQKEAEANLGLLTAVWVSGEKLGLALGGAAAGVLLGLAGYVSGGQAQPASALAAIPLLFATGPALMLACSAPLLFKLDRLRRRQGQPL